jgi:hypothetical protein
MLCKLSGWGTGSFQRRSVPFGKRLKTVFFAPSDFFILQMSILSLSLSPALPSLQLTVKAVCQILISQTLSVGTILPYSLSSVLAMLLAMWTSVWLLSERKRNLGASYLLPFRVQTLCCIVLRSVNCVLMLRTVYGIVRSAHTV